MSTFVETGLGGDTLTGAVTIHISKQRKADATTSVQINMDYATYDGSGNLVRTGNTGDFYSQLTPTQQTYLDAVVTKSITIAKTLTSIA